MINENIIETSGFIILVRRKYDYFLKKETGEIEFCLFVRPTYYACTDDLFFMEVSKSILLLLISPQKLQGAAGSKTYLSFNFLNKRIVERGDTFVGAEYVFNGRRPYLHGKVETNSYTKNDSNELVQFRAKLFFGNIAEFTYEIR